MQYLSSILLCAAALTTFTPAHAQLKDTAPAKPAAKAAAKPAPARKAAAKPVGLEAPKVLEDDDDDGKGIDVQTSAVTEFTCDMGAKVSFYKNAEDNDHVAVRWGKDIMRMKRVPTTTGADRFESKRHGLVWIGIPAKSILLDSKKGQQLANGCKHEGQMAAHPQG